ncbi:MAG TPA: hypothetical protein VGQ19_12950 [Burkholderiales bacterium]|jgi:hypothetical protein|nr:hypothetical protein [Burkholderiales bacterium]
MTYQPIENYGMIGGMHTVALVGPTAQSIGFVCRTSTAQASLPRSWTTGSLCKELGPAGSLQIMYGKHLVEETLDHLDGYLGSKPVRMQRRI